MKENFIENARKASKGYWNNDKWNKPIFFGELGFPKIDGASIHPWNPYENNTGSSPVYYVTGEFLYSSKLNYNL